jgi:DNA-binding NtrC family response regulator
MTTERRTPATGSGHLEQRSALRKRIAALGVQPRILVIEDLARDARFIETTVRLHFGPDALVKTTRSAKELASMPSDGANIIVLDDIMDMGKKAEQTIPLLRRSGFTGPIVVVSQLMTFSRQAALRRLGVIHSLVKDDADPTRLAEVIVDALDAATTTG